jgi:cell division protein FtsB
MTDASNLHFTPLPRRRRDNPWLLRAVLVVTIVMLVDAVFGDRGIAETRKAKRAYAETYANLAQLRSTNAGLREQARRLAEDAATIEDVARKELGLMRDGEVMFVLKPTR